MKKIFVMIAAVICAITCTGCGHVKTEEEIKKEVFLSSYEQITGKNGKDLSMIQMQRDLVKTEMEKKNVGHWTYEGTEYDRVQTFHSYLDDGTRFYIVYDLDTGESLDYGTED